MKVRERFQIYVAHIGSIASGQLITDYPKTFDTEAPFALRGIALRVARDPSSVTAYSAVNNLNIRWKDANNMYTYQDLLPVPVALRVGTGGFGGIGGCPGIVYPEIVYPAGGHFSIDLQNTGATALDTTIYLWGVKLFAPGSIDSPTYPGKCALLDYTRQFTALNLGLTEFRPNQILKIAADADYILSGGQGGCNNVVPYFGRAFSPYQNLLLTISDHNYKPFMDAGVDINYLLGTSQGTFGQGSGFTGNPTPGLFVPEIYVRANDLLYLDFNRQDGAYSGHSGYGPVTVQLAFVGRKAYLKP